MKIITVCGSGRFKPLIHGVCEELSQRGLIVLKPPLHDIMGATQGAAKLDEANLLAWKGATFAHFNRIAKADICVMLNPGGYLGASSTLEMGYAVALHKLIVALRHDAELSRDGLFDIILETEELLEIANRIEKLARD